MSLNLNNTQYNPASTNQTNQANLDSSIDPDSSLFILNEKNIYITAEYIESVLKKYNIKYKVKNLKTFQLAVTHTSYLNRDTLDNQKAINKNNAKTKKQMIHKLEPIKDPKLAIPLQDNSYERLEFLGDSVIHLMLANYLFNRYKDEYEGFLTKLRTKIENSDTLASLSQAMGLDKYVLISRYMESVNSRTENMSVLEDSFEAFIGALLLDSDFDTCNKFLIAHLEKHVDFAEILNTETNFKDRLLQYHHQQKWEDPTYGVLDISGPAHNKNFTMYVKCRKNPLDDGEIAGVGVSNSKKKGEQEAAKQALISYGEVKEENDDLEDEIVVLD